MVTLALEEVSTVPINSDTYGYRLFSLIPVPKLNQFYPPQLFVLGKELFK